MKPKGPRIQRSGELLNSNFIAIDSVMRIRFFPFALIAFAVLSGLFGTLCASLTCVATYEELTQMRIAKLADSILRIEKETGVEFSNGESLISSGLFKQKELVDVWENPITITRLPRNGFRLSSSGDPEALKINPNIRQEIFIDMFPSYGL